jgi:hypothetical protein
MGLTRELALVTILVVLAACVAAAGCSKKSSEEVKLGGIDTTEMLQGLLDRTARTLGGVRDMASAEAAAKKLRGINDDFDDLLYHVPKLSPKGRQELAKKAQKSMPQLQTAVSQINSNRAMAEVLGPEMGVMLEKLTQLAAAPEA